MPTDNENTTNTRKHTRNTPETHTKIYNKTTTRDRIKENIAQNKKNTEEKKCEHDNLRSSVFACKNNNFGVKGVFPVLVATDDEEPCVCGVFPCVSADERTYDKKVELSEIEQNNSTPEINTPVNRTKLEQAIIFFENSKKEVLNCTNKDEFIEMFIKGNPGTSEEDIVFYIERMGKLTPKNKGVDKSCVNCGEPGKHKSSIVVDRNTDRIEYRCDKCYEQYQQGPGVSSCN